jgi:hypothetical protein
MSTQKPAELRMLDALNYCDSMAQFDAVDLARLIEQASQHGHVDRHELAVLWLAQLVAAQRARQALASMREGDES